MPLTSHVILDFLQGLNSAVLNIVQAQSVGVGCIMCPPILGDVISQPCGIRQTGSMRQLVELQASRACAATCQCQHAKFMGWLQS